MPRGQRAVRVLGGRGRALPSSPKETTHGRREGRQRRTGADHRGADRGGPPHPLALWMARKIHLYPQTQKVAEPAASTADPAEEAGDEGTNPPSRR